MRVAGLVEHPADGGGLGVLHLAGLDLLGEVGDEQRERGALADAVDHAGERFDVAELGRPRQAVLAGDPLAVKRHRLAHERPGAPSSASAGQLLVTSSVAGNRECHASGMSVAPTYPWLPSVFVISSVLTGGAVLRVTGRVFLGWGAAERHEDVQTRQPREDDEERIERDVTPPLMLIVPAVLLLGAIVAGLIPGLVPAIETAAARFADHAAYATWVLQGTANFATVPASHIETFDYLYGAAATLGALAIAALTLFGARLRRSLPGGFEGPPRAALSALRELHSGHIGDYIAWWTIAAAMLGGACLILLT